MLRYGIQRAGVSIAMFVLVSLLLFLAVRVMPGDPTTPLALNPGITEEQVAAVRAELALDRPLPAQFVDWASDALRGDLGRSYFSGYTTTELIGQRLGATFELCLAGLLIAIAIALPLAVASALRPYSTVDKLLGVGTSAVLALPGFWLGVMFIWLFSVELGWLPSRGYVSLFSDPIENVKHLAMPAITLGIGLSALIARFLRASLLETLSSDYVRTAESKGLRWRQVVIKHALPNALLPTLHFLGLLIGSMLGIVIIIEWVFGWPGLGSLTIDAVGRNDYIVLQGVVLMAAATAIVASLIVDLVTGFLDPRVRRGRR